MKCSKIKELLAAYANNQLPSDRKQLVESHIENCIDCRATLADYRVIGERLMSLRTMADIPDIDNIKLPDLNAIRVKRPLIRMRPALAAIPVAIIMIILAVFQPWVTVSGPQAVLAKAIAATENIQSYRVTISPFLVLSTPPNPHTINSECEFVAPDRIHIKLTMDDVVNEYLLIGDKQYYLKSNNLFIYLGSLKQQSQDVQNHITFAMPWMDIPSKENTLTVLESITNLRVLPDEIIDGTNCLHYQGNDKTSPGTTVELWIGSYDNLIRQITRTTLRNSEADPATRVTKYYDFNTPITIETPVTASGDWMPGWALWSVIPSFVEAGQTTTTESSSTDATTTTLGFN